VAKLFIKKERKFISICIVVATLTIALFSTVRGQTIAPTVFTPVDKFDIPACNSTISFNTIGNYTSARLENNMWTFYGLQLNGSLGAGDLSFGAQNSNVTIRRYSIFNYTDVNTRIGALFYDVQGQGTQTFNLGLNTTQSEPYQWTIVTGAPIVFLVEGEGWSLLPNNTIIMRDASYNVSISRYGFTVGDRSQHSVVIATWVLTGCTVAAATGITFYNRRKGRDER
jgi:hypothetical protein